jgi:hypothetical protein
MQCTRVLTAGDIEHAAELYRRTKSIASARSSSIAPKQARHMRPALTPIAAGTAIHALATARSVQLNAGGVKPNLTRLSRCVDLAPNRAPSASAIFPEQGVVASTRVTIL